MQLKAFFNLFRNACASQRGALRSADDLALVARPTMPARPSEVLQRLKKVFKIFATSPLRRIHARSDRSNAFKKKLKKIKIFAALLVVFLLSTPTFGTLFSFSSNPLIPIASAQSGSFSGTGNEIVCRNGGRDWISFLSAVISYDDFVEYLRDIVGFPPLIVNSRYTANMCLFLDIDNLVQRITKARAQLRQAFYACDAGVDKLKAAYYRLEAELFFLRKYVSVENGSIAEANPQEVLNDLNAYFVLDKGFLSADEMKTLYEQFKSKYAARFEAYKNCSDPTWENLMLKFQELKDHITNGFGIKASAENVANTFDKAINTPYQRTGNLLGGLLDAKINDLEPRDALSDIGAALAKNSPGGKFTIEQLQSAQQADEQRYDDALTRTTYLTQYDLLYRQSSGDIITSIVDRLEYLQKSITSTFPYINQTVQCTKGILDKAC